MQINEEKQRKLKRYREEKEGRVKSSSKETCEYLLKEVNYNIKNIMIHNLYIILYLLKKFISFNNYINF